MPRTFDPLFLLRRRRPPRDERPGEQPAIDAGALALEGAELGPPPVLLPAAIFRQVLYDPAEFTPAWLRPRPAPDPDLVKPARPTVDETVVADAAPVADVADLVEAAPAVGPKPAKRTRRPKADGSTSPARPRSKRVPRPSKDADDR